MHINSILALPFANLIRAAAMIEGCGICGLCVDSINMVGGTTIHSHQLLAHLLSVKITKAPSSLKLHQISLNIGPVSVSTILDQISGIEYEDSGNSRDKIFQATEPVSFYVITGTYTIKTPLTEDMIQTFFYTKLGTAKNLITAPMPFVTRNNFQYKLTEQTQGSTEVSFEDLSEKEVKRILADIIEVL